MKCYLHAPPWFGTWSHTAHLHVYPPVACVHACCMLTVSVKVSAWSLLMVISMVCRMAHQQSWRCMAGQTT